MASQDKSGLFSAVARIPPERQRACVRSKSTRPQSRLLILPGPPDEGKADLQACIVHTCPLGRAVCPPYPGFLTGSHLSYYLLCSLCLLVPYPHLLPLVTTSLFWKSVSLFLFCYIHPCALLFRFHIQSCLPLIYFTKHNAL